MSRPKHPALAVALTLAALLAGCVTPAAPLSEADLAALAPFAAPDPAPESPVPARPHALNGDYEATFQSWFVGPVNVRFKAEPLDNGRSFKANTRPDVAWKHVPGLVGAVGPFLAAFIFPRGMILHWTSTTPIDAAPGDGWIGITTVGPLRAKTHMASPEGPVEIRTREDKLIGAFSIKRLDHASPATPRIDYVSLVDGLDRAARDRFYDPAVAQSPAMQTFIADARNAAAESEDDLEFLFGTVMAWRRQKDLPLPLIYRPAEPDAARLLLGAAAIEQPLEFEFDTTTRVAKVTVNALIDVASIDEAMSQVVAWDPLGVVVDMQNGPGLELAGLRLAAWFLNPPPPGSAGEASVDAGVYFGPAWRSRLGDPALPSVLLKRPSDFAEADRLLDSVGAVRLSVAPVETPYRGRVAVLASKRTISTSETAAWLMKTSLGAAQGPTQDKPRIIIIGERTGKRPMLTRETPIGQGWVSRLAEFDWRPPGVSVEAKWEGLKADVNADRESALRLGALRAAGKADPD